MKENPPLKNLSNYVYTLIACNKTLPNNAPKIRICRFCRNDELRSLKNTDYKLNEQILD